MKHLILAFTLTTQLILSPVAWSATQADCKTGKVWNSKTSACEDCPTGTLYNTSTNTCDVRQDVSEIQGETQECMKLGTPEEQKKCMDENAKNALDESGFEESNPGKNALIAGITVGVGILAIIRSDTKKCQANSVKLMKSAAWAHAASELATYIYYRIRLDDIQDDYKELVYKPKTEDEKVDDKNKRGVNTQDQAFKYLIEQEKLLKDIANVKGALYVATGGLYGTAGILAMKEQAELVTKLKTCNGGAVAAACASYAALVLKYTCNSTATKEDEKNIEANAEDNQYPERAQAKIDAKNEVNRSVEAQKNSSKIKNNSLNLATALGLGFLITQLNYDKTTENTYESYDQILDYVSAIVYQKYSSISYFWSEIFISAVEFAVAKNANNNTSLSAAMKELDNKISNLRKALLKPHTRAAIAAGMTLSTGYLSVHAFKEAGKADKRIEYLEGVRRDFAKNAAPAIAPCSTEDRGNPNKPSCYCYKPEGGKNPERQKSQVCTKQWNENPSLAERGVYEEETINTKPLKLCVSANNTADYGCRCKDEKTGKNKCKFISPSSTFGNIKSNALENSINDANRVYSGDYAGGELAAQNSNQNALGLVKASKKMAKEIGLTKEESETQKQIDNMMTNHSPALTRAFQGTSAFGGGTNSLASLTPELKKEIEKKIGDEFKSIGVEYMSPTGKAAAASGDDFNFNLDDGGGTTIETSSIEELDAMNAKYDVIQNSDIDQRSDSNLFDILSLRYQKSGLRHIFGSKEEQQRLDEANNTDINH